MPSAAATVALARQYDRDYRLAARMVMFMTVLSMITVPLLILVMRRWL